MEKTYYQWHWLFYVCMQWCGDDITAYISRIISATDNMPCIKVVYFQHGSALDGIMLSIWECDYGATLSKRIDVYDKLWMINKYIHSWLSLEVELGYVDRYFVQYLGATCHAVHRRTGLDMRYWCTYLLGMSLRYTRVCMWTQSCGRSMIRLQYMYRYSEPSKNLMYLQKGYFNFAK